MDNYNNNGYNNEQDKVQEPNIYQNNNASDYQQPYGSQNYSAQSYQQPYGSNYNYNQAPSYQQPNYAQNNVNKQDEHMSVLGWIGVFCLNLIPCVGTLVYIIMMFVWAFGNTPKKSLKTYARAQLIILAVVVAIWIIMLIIFSIAGFSIANQFGNSYYGY